MDNNYARRITLSAMLLWASIGNCFQAVAQDGQPTIQPGLPAKKWALDASANTFFTGSNLFVNPIVRADRDWLHLEGRYNYENFSTGSFWAGYNFSVGQKWTLDATPMIGYVFGRTHAIGPGVLVTLTHKRLEWYSEGQFIFCRCGCYHPRLLHAAFAEVPSMPPMHGVITSISCFLSKPINYCRCGLKTQIAHPANDHMNQMKCKNSGSSTYKSCFF